MLKWKPCVSQSTSHATNREVQFFCHNGICEGVSDKQFLHEGVSSLSVKGTIYVPDTVIKFEIHRSIPESLNWKRWPYPASSCGGIECSYISKLFMQPTWTDSKSGLPGPVMNCQNFWFSENTWNSGSLQDIHERLGFGRAEISKMVTTTGLSGWEPYVRERPPSGEGCHGALVMVCVWAWGTSKLTTPNQRGLIVSPLG